MVLDIQMNVFQAHASQVELGNPTRTGWIAKFDLAGVRLEDIHLDVQDHRLTLRGLRRDWLIQEGCYYHSLEIAYSRFERGIEFPADLTQATITTDYQAGML